ncbi:hypothetical protein ACFQ7F_34455 [Streptomyces sp. NPDC056486]|uniref:hypothetical protein n=1 Tax=Streptomyces sp. NPDC056486 TaxID=3345835 RepID=UPI0036A64BBC
MSTETRRLHLTVDHFDSGVFGGIGQEPYVVAGPSATLDLLGKGRGGWRVTATPGDADAANFGPHAARDAWPLTHNRDP